MASEKALKAAFDGIVLLVLLLLLGVIASSVGLLRFGIQLQTYALAFATLVLSGSTFLFNRIQWQKLGTGPQVLNRGRADLQLTMVSIACLFTAVAMAIIEVLALLVFIGSITDVGSAGAALAGNFVLIQTVILLVYLLALVSRENNPSHYTPRKAAKWTALALTPIAYLAVLLGAAMASGIVHLAGVQPHQAVYVVTLGVMLEFVAMRIRMRLPSLWSTFSRAVGQAKRPDQEMKDLLRKRAVRTYVVASVFVALSMAFAGVVATGAVGLRNTGVVTSLVVFYVGTALILIGLVVVRMLQSRAAADRPLKQGASELERLVRQKRFTPQQVARMAIYGITGFLALVAAVLCITTGMDRAPWNKKYATDLFIVAVMLGAGPAGLFYNRERKRIAAVDDKFPDFLRDIAESARAGMTLPRALVTAAQGSYGALTPEIKQMAAQVEWGVDFGTALERFAKRCHTPLIDRTVALVVEAQRAGGSMVDILTAASEDAREIKQIVAERNSQMSMYNVVIYISFFVFIVVVLVLAAQFIPAFKKAVSGASGQHVGGLSLTDFDPEDFNAIFFQAAVVQAIGGGLVGGVLTKGNPMAGFQHIAIMLVIAWLSFRVGVGLL